MRRVLALALGLCLWAAPALAGFTKVTGTGNAGSLFSATGIGTSSGGVAITAAANVGDLVVIWMMDYDTGTNTPNCANADGSGLNTWTKATGDAATNGAGSSFWYSVLAHALTNGTTLSCSTTGTVFVMGAMGWRPTGTAAFDTNATAVTGAGGNVTVGPTPTLACPSGAANCEVCLGGVSWHSTSGTVGSDATWTTLDTFGGAPPLAWAYKLVSATTALSYADTYTGSANNAGALACFKDTPAVGGSVYGGLTTTGVGP